MLYAIALYFFLVALLALGAGWLTMLINGVKPRLSLGLYFAFDPIAQACRRSLFHGTVHGPQSWAWWKFVSFAYIPLRTATPSTGHRLWVYTRWGAWFHDVILDRRSQVLNVEKTNA